MRYSQSLPPRLVNQYQTTLNDSERLSGVEEIALVDARIDDLLKRVDSGESGSLWRKLHKHVQEFITAQATKDNEKTVTALHQIIQTVKKGAGDYLAWEEIARMVDRRCRLVRAEREHLQEMQNYISSEQATRLVSALISSVNQRVKDPQIKAAISQDILAIVKTESQTTPV